MERQYAAELNDQNLSAIFAGCDDFIRRELCFFKYTQISLDSAYPAHSPAPLTSASSSTSKLPLWLDASVLGRAGFAVPRYA